MKQGGTHLFWLYVCWAAAGLAVAAAEARKALELKLPPSESGGGHHDRGRHHFMRHTPPAIDTRKGLSPRTVQHEIEQMANRADSLARKDPKSAAQVQGMLEDVEADLATRVGDDKALADEIRAVRAELCSKKGFNSHQSADCEAFMLSSCYPKQKRIRHQARQADDDDEDADPNTLMVPTALCQQYFGGQANGRFIAAGPAPAQGAPAPAPAPPGVAAQEFSFDKYHQPLPEQGFHGHLVEHSDQDTQTADWQREFGPRAGHRSYKEICKERPNNRWCRTHVLSTVTPPQKSGTLPRAGAGLLAAAAAAALLGLAAAA